ncbi:MAG: hypothetical protein U0470_09355 [Anaerolineae bacterium]
MKVDAAGPDAWSDVQVAKALIFMPRPPLYEAVRRRVGRNPVYGSRRADDRIEVDGEQEARLIASTCSEPPSGRARWTMKLLADRLVAMEVVESIDPATVHAR